MVCVGFESYKENMVRCRKKYLLVLLSAAAIYVLYDMYRDKNRHLYEKYFPDINYTVLVSPQVLHQGKGRFSSSRKQKTILLYTSHFYSDVWKNLEPEILDGYAKNAGCDIPECDITYDKSAIAYADIVVFHGVDFGSKNYTSKNFQALAKLKPSHQRWVYWMHESPVYYPEDEDYDNLFNWTMTFSRKSDIYHPYFSYEPLDSSDEKPSAFANYASRKSKQVAWIVSSCGKTRGDYALELQKYVHLTVYGLCGASFDHMGGVCSYAEHECASEIGRYKFYLAFENSFCEDYVTEKYYKYGLIWGAVPVVMGAKYDSLNAVPGSYIDASKFPSIKELGEYLNYLSDHDDAYNMYFEWKKHYKVTTGPDKICLLCKAAHDLTRPKKVYKNFYEFWSEDNLCRPYEALHNKFDWQVKESKESQAPSRK